MDGKEKKKRVTGHSSAVPGAIIGSDEKSYKIKLQVQDIQDVWRWINVQFTDALRRMQPLTLTSSTGLLVSVPRPGELTDVRIVPHAHVEQRSRTKHAMYWHEAPIASMLLLRCEQIEVYRSALKEHVDVFAQAVKKKSGAQSQAMVLYVTNVKSVCSDAQILKKRRATYRKIYQALKSDFPKLSVFHLAVADPGVDQRAAFADLINMSVRKMFMSEFDARSALYREELARLNANQHLPLWNACHYLLVKLSFIELHKDFNLLQESVRLYDELVFLLDNTDLRPLLLASNSMPGALLSTHNSSGEPWQDLVYRNQVSELELMRFVFAERFRLFVKIGQPERAAECLMQFVHSMVIILQGRRMAPPPKKAPSSSSSHSHSSSAVQKRKKKKGSGASIFNTIRRTLSGSSRERDDRNASVDANVIALTTFPSSKLNRFSDAPSSIPLNKQYAWILVALLNALEYIVATANASSSSSLAAAVRLVITIEQHVVRVLCEHARKQRVVYMRGTYDVEADIAKSGGFEAETASVLFTGDGDVMVDGKGVPRSYSDRLQRIESALDTSKGDEEASCSNEGFSAMVVTALQWGLSHLRQATISSRNDTEQQKDAKHSGSDRRLAAQLLSRMGVIQMQRGEYGEARECHTRVFQCFLEDGWTALALRHLQWAAVCCFKENRLRACISDALRAMVLAHHYAHQLKESDFFLERLFMRAVETDVGEEESCFVQSEIVDVRRVVLLPDGEAQITLLSRFPMPFECRVRLSSAAQAESKQAAQGTVVTLLPSSETQVLQVIHSFSLSDLYAMQQQSRVSSSSLPQAQLDFQFGASGSARSLRYDINVVAFEAKAACQLHCENTPTWLCRPVVLRIDREASHALGKQTERVVSAHVMLPKQLQFRDSGLNTRAMVVEQDDGDGTLDWRVQCQVHADYKASNGTQAHIYMAVVVESVSSGERLVWVSRASVDVAPRVLVRVMELPGSLLQVFLRCDCSSLPITLSSMQEALRVPEGWSVELWDTEVTDASIKLIGQEEHSVIFSITRDNNSTERRALLAFDIACGNDSFAVAYSFALCAEAVAIGRELPLESVVDSSVYACRALCELKQKKENATRVDLNVGVAFGHRASGERFRVIVRLREHKTDAAPAWLLLGRTDAVIDADESGDASIAVQLLRVASRSEEEELVLAECTPVVRVTHVTTQADVPVRLTVRCICE